MVPTAYLKAFEPLDAFGRAERAHWQRLIERSPAQRLPRRVFLSPNAGLREILDATPDGREEADVVERDGVIYVCPHRTRLRLLASVLAFRRSIPAEAAGAFLAEKELREVVAELERLREERPEWRNHILQSSWEIPLRWFVLFEEHERNVLDDGGAPTARYETRMPAARERIQKALGILRASLPNPAVVGLVADLSAWLEQFNADSRLMLEYGDVARLLGREGLAEEHTARDLWAAIDSLKEGDPDRAAAYYGQAAERWSRMRSLESAN